MKERFQRAPVGARIKRCLSCEIPRFRYGQQPKLRESYFVKSVSLSSSLVLSERR